MSIAFSLSWFSTRASSAANNGLFCRSTSGYKICGGAGHLEGTHSEQRILRGDTGVVVWCNALPEFLAFSCELLPDFECEVWVCVRVVIVIGQRVKGWYFSSRHLGLVRVEQCKRYASGDKFRDWSNGLNVAFVVVGRE